MSSLLCSYTYVNSAAINNNSYSQLYNTDYMEALLLYIAKCGPSATHPLKFVRTYVNCIHNINHQYSYSYAIFNYYVDITQSRTEVWLAIKLMMNMKVTLQLLQKNYELLLVVTILCMLNISIGICIVDIIKLSLIQKL